MNCYAKGKYDMLDTQDNSMVLMLARWNMRKRKEQELFSRNQ